MKDNYAGKFCSVCEKSVFDFTKSSDAEIDTILKRYNYKACAKFRKDQLNRPLNLPQQKIYFSSFLKIISGLMLFGATEKVVANTSKSDTFESVFTEDFKNRINENRLVVRNDTTKRYIEGVVLSEDGQTMDSVLVKILKHKIEALTDYEGKFKIEIPLSYKETDTLKLAFYDGKHWNFKAFQGKQPIEVIFYKTKQMNPVLIGTVVIRKKKHWWQFWKKKYQ